MAKRKKGPTRQPGDVVGESVPISQDIEIRVNECSGQRQGAKRGQDLSVWSAKTFPPGNPGKARDKKDCKKKAKIRSGGDRSAKRGLYNVI